MKLENLTKYLFTEIDHIRINRPLTLLMSANYWHGNILSGFVFFFLLPKLPQCEETIWKTNWKIIWHVFILFNCFFFVRARLHTWNLFSPLDKILYIFTVLNYSKSQSVQDVRTTLWRRCMDVETMSKRLNDVVITLFWRRLQAGNEFLWYSMSLLLHIQISGQ